MSGDGQFQKSKLHRMDATEDDSAKPGDVAGSSLPEGTPELGVKLLEIMQSEFRSFTSHMNTVEVQVLKNKSDVSMMSKKLDKIETENRILHEENTILKECLLNLEYRQRQCNLIIDGINDSLSETDIACISKVRNALASIPNFDAQGFVIDKCHRLNGKFKVNQCRRILCTFNWYHDIQTVLKNRKYLPKGIFVNEDFPEEWIDRRRILKPIFAAAK